MIKTGDILISKINHSGNIQNNKHYVVYEINDSALGEIILIRGEYKIMNVLLGAIYDYFYSPQEMRKIKLKNIEKL